MPFSNRVYKWWEWPMLAQIYKYQLYPKKLLQLSAALPKKVRINSYKTTRALVTPLKNRLNCKQKIHSQSWWILILEILKNNKVPQAPSWIKITSREMPQILWLPSLAKVQNFEKTSQQCATKPPPSQQRQLSPRTTSASPNSAASTTPPWTTTKSRCNSNLILSKSKPKMSPTWTSIPLWHQNLKAGNQDQCSETSSSRNTFKGTCQLMHLPHQTKRWELITNWLPPNRNHAPNLIWDHKMSAIPSLFPTKRLLKWITIYNNNSNK